MATPKAVAIKTERERQARQDQLDRIEQMLSDILDLLSQGAEYSAPVKSAGRVKDGTK